MVCDEQQKSTGDSLARKSQWWRKSLPTPYLAVKLDEVEQRYREFRHALPNAPVYYALKANPALPVASHLAHLGANFDIASAAELLLVLELGVPPSRISFGNTIKRPADIELAHGIGVTHFAVDSIGEIDKIAVRAPGASVTVRLLVDCQGAEWPLSRKFGCDRDMALHLVEYAKSRSLVPFGLSFHVGSQQTNLNAWDEPLRQAASIFEASAARGIQIDTLNLGGGFPAQYCKAVPSVAAYGEAINASLRRWFPKRLPNLMIEPGRGLVADAGVLVSEVLLSSHKSANDPLRWIYLDCGLFGGLIETLGEAIRYRIETDHDNTARGPAVIAGPTCDSTDIMYERAPYELPLQLTAGDHVRILSAGAYTYTCALAGFNGFAPLQCICV
jgi:ornithine decarboxylase